MDRLAALLKTKCTYAGKACFTQFALQEERELLEQRSSLPKETHAQILSSRYNPDSVTNVDDLEALLPICWFKVSRV